MTRVGYLGHNFEEVLNNKLNKIKGKETLNSEELKDIYYAYILDLKNSGFPLSEDDGSFTTDIKIVGIHDFVNKILEYLSSNSV